MPTLSAPASVGLVLANLLQPGHDLGDLPMSPQLETLIRAMAARPQ